MPPGITFLRMYRRNRDVGLSLRHRHGSRHDILGNVPHVSRAGPVATIEARPPDPTTLSASSGTLSESFPSVKGVLRDPHRPRRRIRPLRSLSLCHTIAGNRRGYLLSDWSPCKPNQSYGGFRMVFQLVFVRSAQRPAGSAKGSTAKPDPAAAPETAPEPSREKYRSNQPYPPLPSPGLRCPCIP